MPRKLIDFELDFMIKDIFPRFTVKQFDDVSFNIKPKKQGLDYDTTGMTGKIFIGVNNDMFMQTKNITVSNNNVNILLDRNMLQKNGRAYAEVELTDSNGTITSSSFIFNIDAKIGEGAKIPGEYEGFVAKYERLISEFKAQVNSTIDNCKTNINSTINNCNKTVDNKLNDVDNFIDNKILDIEKRFNTLTSSQQQEAEVIDARDGEVSLKARLDRDLYKDGMSLSDRIEAIEGLKDSQNMKYETDKGYLVCKETKNGVIDDLKIEGKTLVNLVDYSNNLNNIGSSVCTSIKNNQYYKFEVTQTGSLFSLIKTLYDVSNKDITLIIDNKSNFTPTLYKRTGYTFIKNLVSGFNVIKVNTDSLTEGFGIGSLGDRTEGDILEYSIIILEGDHTQNPPSYFEGLMSVGQDVDKIEVLSSNGNMFDIGNSILNDKTRIEDGVIYTTNVANANGYFIVDIPLDNPIITFKLHSNSGSVNDWWAFNFKDYITNKDNFINAPLSNVGNVITKQTSLSKGKYKVYMGANTNTSLSLGLKDVTIGYSIKTISNYKQDKKQILFYNENGELEPIQELHEWDSIEKHSDNKWDYHKRSGKVVLNGSEEFYLVRTTDNTIVFGTDLSKVSINNLKMILSDKFNFIGDDIFEQIRIGNSGRSIFISILKSKLPTQDVEGFKQWLQANNVTAVYQLAQEEVYELAPLHLDSYANETLILCNSGAISPKMEFSITSHINELVKAYGERVNLLEEKVYQYMIAQNRMQLASTYSADSVTFKVDYFSLCGDEENYDEDLYNLILNNILVGKDNYNYDKMFTIILDYASWNQISWEQFDILVGLMDMQHNPPVEELPTEDGIEEDIIENEETPVE